MEKIIGKEENMKRTLLFAGLVVSLLLGFSSNSYAVIVNVINPSDDGCIYPNGPVVTSSYLLSAGYIRGVVEFPLNSVTYNIEKATLSINPYSLPLWGKSVNLYGYASNDGKLTFADYNAGDFLGTWTLPDNLWFGQDAYFDVTDFMSQVKSPYVGFNLRSNGTDVFSSVEYNYGHPAQLSLVPTPEPASMLLFGLGGLGMAFIRRKQKA